VAERRCFHPATRQGLEQAAVRQHRPGPFQNFASQTGALGKVGNRHPGVEAQRIHQKLERQLGGGDGRTRRTGIRRCQVTARLADLARAQNPVRPGIGQLAVSAGADADVIPEFPVIAIVTARSAGPGVGRYLVLGITLGTQQRRTRFANGVDHRLGRQYRAAAIELGIGFDGELIPGDMPGIQGDGLLEVGNCLRLSLPGQAVHQIQIEIIEAGLSRCFGGVNRFVLAMNPAKRLQMCRIKTLHANRQPIDAGRPISLEPALLQRARIGFQRDLGVRSNVYSLADLAEQFLIKIPGHQARRAATDKHGFDTPPGHLMQIGADILNQGRQIGLLRNVATLMGIEIAVRALAHAPGHMNVERQRNQECLVQSSL